jgi:hypothetical protein
MMMDSMSGIQLRGVCSNYFENHVSPVLKYIQQSQERLDKRMDDVAQKLEAVNESLQRKPNRDEVTSNSDLEAALSRSARGSDKPVMSVPVLSRLQELSTMVQKKADASEISRLAALVEQKATVTQKKSDSVAHVNMENFTVLVDQKLDSIREPLLKQYMELSKQIEAIAATIDGKAESKDVATLEQWQKLEKDVQNSSSTMVQVEELASQLDKVVLSLGNKADSKDVPSLLQWKRLEKDVEGISSSPASPKSSGEKSDLKKIQMLVAAAGARFDRQLKELRQQVRELKESSPSRQVDSSQVEDNRWPGRVIRESTDDDVDSEIGRIPQSHCGSIPDSLAGSVTGLGPEERAELQKIQAVVGAAGTAFSKEIRELKKQFNVLNAEIMGLKEHVSTSKPSVAGA